MDDKDFIEEWIWLMACLCLAMCTEMRNAGKVAKSKKYS